MIGTSKKGIKSPASQEGKAALDNFIQVKNKGHYDRRVGMSNMKLSGALRNNYHGHARI